MQILFWSLIFIIALTATIKSVGYFTDAAEKIGLHYRISPFIIGVTIVAFGTSLPELATSITSVIHNSSEIVIGNVVGSNIANILFVLGITAIIGKHLYVDKEIMNIDLPLLFSSAMIIFFTTLDKKFTYLDAIICLLMLLAYLLYNIKSHRSIATSSISELSKIRKESQKEKLYWKHPVVLIISATVLYFAADYTIVAVTALSQLFSIGKDIIAISAIAIGTSLPELAVSAIAAKRGKADIAIGNVTGSNIFNSLGVMGIPALFGDLKIPSEMINFFIPTMLFVTILYVFVTMDKQVTKWEGFALVSLYVAFLGKTFGLI